MAGGDSPVTTDVMDYLAIGDVDREGRLLTASEPLASLQIACGGDLGGPLAIPELRAIATKASDFGLRLSRPFCAIGDDARVTGWVDAVPNFGESGGCQLAIASWQAEPITPVDEDAELAAVRREVNRALPEFSARLDPRQAVLTVETGVPDLADLAASMIRGVGRPWTDFVTVTGSLHDQPVHWRLLDGAACEIAGSDRRWTAWLEPIGRAGGDVTGFVLTLVSDQAAPLPLSDTDERDLAMPSLGEELAPVLRQPLGRVIANAGSIRAKLAGPLPDIYAGYAGDMVDAGQHLLALIEDITDLEGVEASDFQVALDRIDLGDAARQAAAILGAKAQERDIVLAPPPPGEHVWARGEFRRVLQVLINLIGNAIAYSPEESQVWIRLDREGRHASVTVADQGRGLSETDQGRVFDKFERLGRSGDGGSGLGLYIAARLAQAMDGTLSVESAPGQGARFTLSLPTAD